MKVQICKGNTCSSKFSYYIAKRLQNDKIFYKRDNVIIENIPCLGQCSSGPNILIDGTPHNFVSPIKASTLVYHTKKKKKKHANK